MPLTSADTLAGTILIAAPHMDDEVLGCGGLIAQLADPGRVHVVYATDGMKSPAPLVPGRQWISPDLGQRRREESTAAMAVLGVPAANLHFLDLPEGELRRHAASLERLLGERLQRIAPDVILAPFRYDRHPDHLAVNRVVTAAVRSGETRATLLEYFIYHRSRLLPGGDVRACLPPESLLRVEVDRVAARKRAALVCFETQTTIFYPWQTRPILQPALIDEECTRPEQFLRYDPARAGARAFTRAATWNRIANRIEPALVRWKYRVKSALGRA
jgi:LmbE family N-acetylglucosaminyl deacetylase